MLSSKKSERKTGLGPATPTLARLCSTNWAISAYQIITVKRRRLELPRHNCHYPLKVARLPIPPSLQRFSAQNRTRTCMPLDTRTWNVRVYHSATWAFWWCQRAENETRTRDPNLGKVVLYQLSYFRNEHFSKCGAKVRIFSYPPKFTEQKSC